MSLQRGKLLCGVVCKHPLHVYTVYIFIKFSSDSSNQPTNQPVYKNVIDVFMAPKLVVTDETSGKFSAMFLEHSDHENV